MVKQELTGNFAYIDNQNLYVATHYADKPWDVDMRRLRVYLREKYNVIRAYLFMGAWEPERQDLYIAFQECGYILIWREHGVKLKGEKKGNVDVDVVFEMMRDNFTNAQMEKAVLLSGDGDYYRTVDYLIGLGKFEKIIHPSHRGASSLYKSLSDGFRVFLDNDPIKKKLGR